jgi:hypothetical protein
LAAFVDVRREYVLKYDASQGTLLVSTTETLASAMEQLTRARSEGGGRAQAAAGGLIDALVGPTQVRVGKRNEPDRHMPGDVGIRAADESTSYARVFEVRDKNVPSHAVLSFITKVAGAGVNRAVLVAIAARQETLDTLALRARAREMGVGLEIFTSWAELVRAVIFASAQPEQATIETAVATIRDRLIQLELSVEAVALWDELTLLTANAESSDQE